MMTQEVGKTHPHFIAPYETGLKLIHDPKKPAPGEPVVPVDNRKFHDSVKAASQKLGSSTADIRRYHVESGLIENDWKKDTNGESYRQRLNERGRSGLLEWVDNWASPRLQEINRNWKARIEARGAGP
jgi:hypothetical protein